MGARGDEAAPLPIVEAAQRAAERVDELGDVDLTLKLVHGTKPHTKAEGGFGGGDAEIYVVGSILDGSGAQPDFKTKLFQGMRAGQDLPLGAGGMLIGMIRKPRWFVDAHVMMMESDSDLRAVGEAIERARKDSGLKELVDAIGTVATFDPTMITRVTAGVDVFLAMLAGILKRNGDDHIATFHDFYLKSQAFGAGEVQTLDVAGRALFRYQVEILPAE
jgi:hypothetical protein